MWLSVGGRHAQYGDRIFASNQLCKGTYRQQSDLHYSITQWHSVRKFSLFSLWHQNHFIFYISESFELFKPIFQSDQSWISLNCCRAHSKSVLWWQTAEVIQHKQLKYLPFSRESACLRSSYVMRKVILAFSHKMTGTSPIFLCISRDFLNSWWNFSLGPS